MSEYTEKEIIEQALPIIDSYGRISTSKLVEKLFEAMKPSGIDLLFNDSRNDTKFSQKVRNIKSHKDTNNIEEFVIINEKNYFSSRRNRIQPDSPGEGFKIDLSILEEEKTNFLGRKVDFTEVNSKNTNSGNAGELLVIDDQRKKLKLQNNPKGHLISHVAKIEGDGLGYDVLSFNPEGENIYIEVKTTTGGLKTPFYMSTNELLFLQQNVEWYIIARVFNYNATEGTAEIKYYSGRELYKNATFTPSNFKVKVSE